MFEGNEKAEILDTHTRRHGTLVQQHYIQLAFPVTRGPSHLSHSTVVTVFRLLKKPLMHLGLKQIEMPNCK